MASSFLAVGKKDTFYANFQNYLLMKRYATRFVLYIKYRLPRF